MYVNNVEREDRPKKKLKIRGMKNVRKLNTLKKEKAERIQVRNSYDPALEETMEPPSRGGTSSTMMFPISSQREIDLFPPKANTTKQTKTTNIPIKPYNKPPDKTIPSNQNSEQIIIKSGESAPRKNFLLDSKCYQLTSFIFKFIMIFLFSGALGYVYFLSSTKSDLLILFGMNVGCMLCNLTISILLFHYIYFKYIKLGINPVQFCCFKVTIGFNLFFFLGSGYVHYLLWLELTGSGDLGIDEDMKTYFFYAVCGTLGVYYLLGIVISQMIFGFLYGLWLLLVYFLTFLYQLITCKLFAKSEESNSKAGVHKMDKNNTKNNTHPTNRDKDTVSNRAVTNTNAEETNSININMFDRSHRKSFNRRSLLENSENPNFVPGMVTHTPFNAKARIKLCMICYAYFVEGDDILCLGCHPDHNYHKKCLMERERKGETNVCPMCWEEAPQI